MKQKSSGYFALAAGLFLLFVLFTALATQVDVQPIGPEGSLVGFAGVNAAAAAALGSSEVWYGITTLLGYGAIAVAGLFAGMGGWQLLRRKSLLQVDGPILLLGGFYALVLFCYVFFEKVVINCRPVILDPAVGLEASYPSSHTVLVLCILGTAMPLLHRYLAGRRGLLAALDGLCLLSMGLMVVGRLLSGVHWLTDILGGVLLSAALVSLYLGLLALAEPEGRRLRK